MLHHPQRSIPFRIAAPLIHLLAPQQKLNYTEYTLSSPFCTNALGLCLYNMPARLWLYYCSWTDNSVGKLAQPNHHLLQQ